MPRFAFYGDDFTGSVDALLQFRRAGLSGLLVTDRRAIPSAASQPVAVVGLAGVSRSLATADLADEVRPALIALRNTGARVVQYKACSTGDSSPLIGSLGRVVELGHEVFDDRPIPVVLAQPDFGRYTFFGNHFAADGERVYRLDRQPTMRNHPTTPATESDLVQHLAAQTDLPIGLLPWTSYGLPTALAEALSGRAAAVVADAFNDEQLRELAVAILNHSDPARFLIGSGGISKALGAAGGTDADLLPPLPTMAEPAAGPMLVLSGSTSARTRDQITASGWPVIDAFADDAVNRTLDLLAAGRDSIVSSTAGITDDGGHHYVFRRRVAPRLAEVGRRALQRGRPPRRMIICGGDTAGGVLKLLGVGAISVVAQPWGNAVLCRASRADSAGASTAEAAGIDGLELVLKGGQMGHRRLFTDVRDGIPLPAETLSAATSPAETPAQ